VAVEEQQAARAGVTLLPADHMSAAASPTAATNHRSGRMTWIALAVLVALIGLHGIGVVSLITYPAVILGGILCGVVGLRQHDLALQWPWKLLMATAGLWMIASFFTDASDSAGDLTRGRSLVPDAFAIPGYIMFGVALAGLLRSRRAGHERDAVLDGIMLAAGAALIVNEVLIAPTMQINDTWLLARIAVAIYPALSMCLLGIAGRLAFGSGERSVSFTLLLLGALSLVVGDFVFALGEIGKLTAGQNVLEVPYLFVPAFIGAAVLHPSVRLVDQPSRERVRVLGPWRLVAVAGALLAPIVVIAIDPSERRAVTVALCAVLAGAAMVRMATAMRTQAASEAKLLHRATHDELTGLPSRAWVLEQTERALDRGDSVALMFLDLDQFKFVNDSMGHTVGDRLLVLVADRLVHTVRAHDVVGRISGDEFIVIAAGLDEEGAQALGDRVRNALREPFVLEEGEVFVSVSIGIAVANGDHGRDAATLIQEADTAMYRSKDAGRDAVTVFDRSMHERVARRIELERLLRKALEERNIEIAYQPIVSIPSGRVRGFEALARWRVGGRMVSPAEFIPVAEETGLIVPLGAYVLDEACRQVAWWRSKIPGGADLYVSVNLSARQVWSSDVVEMVEDALARHELPGDALWLEITESVMMEDSVTTTAVLSALRELGVRLAVDDFGTGYSSLSYLKRFPVARVKIDRSFVAGLGQHEPDTSLVAAIIAMAAALDLEPVAEGVETVEQAERLVRLGCTQAQGHLYGSASSSEEVPRLIAALTPGGSWQAARTHRCIHTSRH
jgi:diguanylate cyclase (GGDEF)-like protein